MFKTITGGNYYPYFFQNYFQGTAKNAVNSKGLSVKIYKSDIPLMLVQP